jgi:hypothetical protein
MPRSRFRLRILYLKKIPKFALVSWSNSSSLSQETFSEASGVTSQLSGFTSQYFLPFPGMPHIIGVKLAADGVDNLSYSEKHVSYGTVLFHPEKALLRLIVLMAHEGGEVHHVVFVFMVAELLKHPLRRNRA